MSNVTITAVIQIKNTRRTAAEWKADVVEVLAEEFGPDAVCPLSFRAGDRIDVTATSDESNEVQTTYITHADPGDEADEPSPTMSQRVRLRDDVAVTLDGVDLTEYVVAASFEPGNVFDQELELEEERYRLPGSYPWECPICWPEVPEDKDETFKRIRPATAQGCDCSACRCQS